MGMIKGQNEYRKFKEGKNLTHKQAILAQCFVCNGSEDSNEDCKGYSCPLYLFHPHNENRLKLHKKPTFSFSKQPKDSQTDMSTSKQERKP